ncbi:membrane dipeptidase [Amycolatopsis rhabdoformis]|uniref:Membrane dipeptidase n=1 Tax=Amycolatopsis rhabdoformis TaxID=1448059 RepID=A0ABZ1IJK7_9PSEU|nr:membrane dipeptidase [Amycolatopsis rhabdoformis]WSE34157.1 membrane dipeptidase [Amycolatopsis rhabdoformis]
MPEPAALHENAVVADAHNDLLMLCARHPAGRQAEYFRRVWLPQLRAGGVDIQVLPVFLEPEFRPEGALRQTLRMIETAWRVEAGNRDAVRMCRTGEDVRETLAEGRIALVLALEGCEAVGLDVGLFETLHRLGVRMASFTHFGRTMLADGSAEDATGSRLTGAGVEAVAACEELGILLDLSHLGATSTDHLLEIATRPLVASHSSAFAVRPHHRNLTDARLRALADAGGVVGINVLAPFVDERDHTVSRVADHLDHAASLIGVTHVGLGPDFIKEVSDSLLRADQHSWDDRAVREFVPGLEGPAGLPRITAELLRRGWPEPDVRQVLGLSFHDLFVKELGVPGSAR